LNHGITVHGDYLYATSASTTYRWRYVAAERKVGPQETVVTGIPSDGHTTRTPRLDKDGHLYVSLGSAGNVDSNSNHAQVRRFDISKTLPVSWNSGMVYADGLRNEVGLNFDKEGRLWGVMNGMDNVHRADLGGDIHNTNPAEELNLLDKPGKFYGYPYCWAEYLLAKGKGPGTMWATEQFMKDGTHTDQWCQNPNNVVRPALALSAHNAPLDVFFYYGDSFGSDYNGDAFVAMHGSWNRQPASGYRVVRIHFENGVPTKETPFFLA
jgi:glucose/arabinose dehydrogenase